MFQRLKHHVAALARHVVLLKPTLKVSIRGEHVSNTILTFFTGLVSSQQTGPALVLFAAGGSSSQDAACRGCRRGSLLPCVVKEMHVLSRCARGNVLIRLPSNGSPAPLWDG